MPQDCFDRFVDDVVDHVGGLTIASASSSPTTKPDRHVATHAIAQPRKPHTFPPKPSPSRSVEGAFVHTMSLDQLRRTGLVTEFVPPKQNWLRPADAPTTKNSKQSAEGFTVTMVSGASSR
ncbi:unannotated protein [freshwater metagenome]|uniref:Unannotated protein n=1 Tax=freshwater metagenome TaxID=449393 RepID=A0A6J7AUR0_9ZZZZ